MSAGQSASEIAERKRAKARKLEEDARKWERGAEGERRIASVLAGLPDGYVVFHDLRLPGSKANVDHLVVAPHGVFAIDTKNFSHAVTLGRGRGADKLWTGGRPVRLEASKWEASTTASLIGVDVTPMMCVIAPSIPEPAFDFAGVRVCDPEHLLSNITIDGARAIDVERVAESVATAFVAQPELRDGARPISQPSIREAKRPSPQPVRRAKGSPKRSKPTKRQTPLWRPLLAIAAVLILLAFWPRIFPAVTDVVTSASQRFLSDLTASNDSTSPATGDVVVAPSASLDASCPTPGSGWVVALGWPGGLPADAVAYSIRTQADDGPITRHDVGGWTDPSEPLPDIRVPDGTALRVITDVLDAGGRIVASTPQLFEAEAAC